MNSPTKAWGAARLTGALLAISAALIASVGEANPDATAANEPPAQPSAATPPQTVAQPSVAAPAGPSAIGTVTQNASPSSQADAGAQPGGIAPARATADAPSAAGKSGRKVLVDDTVTDAQLRQILGKGYRPETQAQGNAVFYCRNEHELGTRFGTKVCRTAARILQDELDSKDATAHAERNYGNRILPEPKP
jgi:hypothetical protein